MNRLTSVVVAVDFSPCSFSALTTAARLARRDGATLHVLHVVETLAVSDLAEALGMSDGAVRELAEDDATEAIQAELARIEAPTGIHIDVSFGAPQREIRRVVEDVQADLLVMGVHGHEGGGKGVGTFATRAIRNAPVDVLLVREGQDGPFTHVLTCTDFSETARRAVARGVSVATRDQARFTLLHVFWGPWHRLSYRTQPPAASPEYRVEYMTLLRSRLARESAEHAEALAGIEHADELFDASHYGEAIARFEKESGADLVVLGTRGRTNLRDVFLGSTAERVLRQTNCSLLAVKPADVISER